MRRTSSYRLSVWAEAPSSVHDLRQSWPARFPYGSGSTEVPPTGTSLLPDREQGMSHSVSHTVLVLVLTSACAQAPTPKPLDVSPLKPASGEVRAIDQVIVIADASGTVADAGLLPETRVITRSLLAAMPPLEVPTNGAPEYKASLI